MQRIHRVIAFAVFAAAHDVTVSRVAVAATCPTAVVLADAGGGCFGYFLHMSLCCMGLAGKEPLAEENRQQGGECNGCRFAHEFHPLHR